MPSPVPAGRALPSSPSADRNGVGHLSEDFDSETGTRPIPHLTLAEVSQRWRAGDVEPPIAITEKPTRNMRRPVQAPQTERHVSDPRAETQKLEVVS